MESDNNLRLIVTLVFFGIIILTWILPFWTWVTARIAHVQISLKDLVISKLRGIPTKELVRALIQFKKAGIWIGKKELEDHFEAGGDIKNISNGLTYAKVHNIELSFDKAVEIDLKGKNIIRKLKRDNTHNNVQTPCGKAHVLHNKDLT